jgi:hypothetical protein
MCLPLPHLEAVPRAGLAELECAVVARHRQRAAIAAGRRGNHHCGTPVNKAGSMQGHNPWVGRGVALCGSRHGCKREEERRRAGGGEGPASGGSVTRAQKAPPPRFRMHAGVCLHARRLAQSLLSRAPAAARHAPRANLPALREPCCLARESSSTASKARRENAATPPPHRFMNAAAATLRRCDSLHPPAAPPPCAPSLSTHTEQASSCTCCRRRPRCATCGCTSALPRSTALATCVPA